MSDTADTVSTLSRVSMDKKTTMNNQPPAQASIDKTLGVATLCIDFPPVNTMSGDHGVPQYISGLLRQLNDDNDVQAIAIYSAGRMFSAGADISEFRGNPDADGGPLRALLETMDSMTKPVVIAMHGMAFGGGLEFALCAHYRIAQENTKIGLPEVTLGLLPGGGGTQRLPRLTGMDVAIDLVTSGRTISATKALEYSLVEELFDGEVRPAAISYAKRLIETKAVVRRVRDIQLAPVDDSVFASVAEKLAKSASRNPGPLKALECLRSAAKMPFDQSLAFEYDAFDQLMQHPQSRGICHAFLSERIAVKIPELRGRSSGKNLSSVAVIGAGTMGHGIALACIKAGLKTALIDQKPDVIARAKAAVEKHLSGQVAKGRIEQVQADAQLELLTFATEYDPVGDADVIIEAVFEDISVKEQVFQMIDAVAKPGAVLASNTSTLDMNAIAAITKRPEDVVGMHFFSPANIMKLLEIVRADQTSDETLLAASEFAKRIGKIGVAVGVCDGFVGNRIMEEYLRQCYFLLEEGALPDGLDTALESWGWTMGGCRVMDLAGQDIGWAIRKRRAKAQPDRPYSKIPDRLCEMGRFGRKTGKGYYLYPEGTRDILVDPIVEKLIVDYSAEIGVTRRKVTPEEIVERTLLAMINEAAKVLDEGIARRPLDIDVIYLNGYGFGRDRGGPMFQADLIGLERIVRRLEELSKGREGWALKPANFLYRMQKHGLTFSDLNNSANTTVKK